MSREHVVQDQQIVFLPRKLDRFLLISLANRIQSFGLDRAAVPVIRVVGQIRFRHLGNKPLANLGFQSGYVEEGGVIEPDLFAGIWMRRYGRAALPNPEPLLVNPLVLDSAEFAMLVHVGGIGGLKGRLPR